MDMVFVHAFLSHIFLQKWNVKTKIPLPQAGPRNSLLKREGPFCPESEMLGFILSDKKDRGTIWSSLTGLPHPGQEL